MIIFNRNIANIVKVLFVICISVIQSIGQCSNDPIAVKYKAKVDANNNVQSCALCAALAVYFCSAKKIYKEDEKQQYRNVIGQTISNIREMGEPICCPELLNKKIQWGTPPVQNNSNSSNSSDKSGSFDASTLDGAIKSASWGLGKALATGNLNEDLLIGGAGLAMNIGMGIANKYKEKKERERNAKELRLTYKAEAIELLGIPDDPILNRAFVAAEQMDRLYRNGDYVYGLQENYFEMNNNSGGSFGQKTLINGKSMSQFYKDPEKYIKLDKANSRILAGTGAPYIYVFSAKTGNGMGTIYPNKSNGDDLTSFDVSPSGKYICLEYGKGLMMLNSRGERLDITKWSTYLPNIAWVSVFDIQYTDLDKYLTIQARTPDGNISLIKDNDLNKIYHTYDYYPQIKKLEGRNTFCMTSYKGKVYLADLNLVLNNPKQIAQKAKLIFDFETIPNIRPEDYAYIFDEPVTILEKENILITTTKNQLHFVNMTTGERKSMFISIPVVKYIDAYEEGILVIQGRSKNRIGMTKMYNLELIIEALNQPKIEKTNEKGINSNFNFSGELIYKGVGVWDDFKNAVYTGIVTDGKMNGHGTLEDDRYKIKAVFLENEMVLIKSVLYKWRNIKYRYYIKDGVNMAIKTFVNDPDEVWIGEIQNLVFNGEVTIFKNKKLLFDGIMKDDHPVSGLFYNDDSTKYDGEFKSGFIAHGEGTTFDKNNNAKYNGTFKDGKKEGKGTFYYKNGDIYSGYWRNGKRSGNGLYSYKNSEKLKYYTGWWKENKKHGPGKTYYIDGSSSSDLWENGKKVKEIEESDLKSFKLKLTDIYKN